MPSPLRTTFSRRNLSSMLATEYDKVFGKPPGNRSNLKLEITECRPGHSIPITREMDNNAAVRTGPIHFVTHGNAFLIESAAAIWSSSPARPATSVHNSSSGEDSTQS